MRNDESERVTLTRAVGVVASILFGALTLVVSLQVLTRFVLHVPFIWSEEVARFLFFWTVLLGATLSVRNRRHFVLDIRAVRGLARGRVARFLFDIIPDLCVLGFSLFLLVQGIGYTLGGLLRTATNSQINMALVYAAIPVFALLSAIYSAARLRQDVGAFLNDGAAAPRPSDAEPGPARGAE